MGYSKEGNIRKFWPDNTDDTIYIESIGDYDLGDIILKAEEKWGNYIELEHIGISAETIQTNCLGYDGYDSSDYTDFIVLTLKKGLRL